MPSNPAILLFGRIIPSPAESSSPSSLRAPDPPSVLQHRELSPRAVADHTVSSLSHGASDDDDAAPLKASSRRPLDAADGALAKPQLVDNSLANDEDSAEKKLDKPVPCPRCNSMDTKFCYFNNYNMKQPRHFCRNCQRYWTAGGTLRNVPIGAGRRKHKLSAIVVPRSDHPDSAQPNHFGHGTDVAGKISDPGLHIPLRRLIDSSPASSSLSSLQQHFPCSSNGVLPSNTQNHVPVERPAQEFFFEFEPKNREEDTVRKEEIQGGTLLSARGRESPSTLIKESTCCSSVTALSAPDVVSDVNEGGTSTITTMPGTLCFPNPATWAGAALPLIWPWPYMYSQNTGPPGVSPLQSDAKRDVSWPPRAEALFPSPPVVATPVWTPYGWSMPWNFVWNANVATAAGAQTHGKRPHSFPEGEADHYVPKTLRIHHPEEEEAGRSSMSLSPPSANGFLNRLKIPDALSQTQPEHTNPAAQARSLAFQERGY